MCAKIAISCSTHGSLYEYESDPFCASTTHQLEFLIAHRLMICYFLCRSWRLNERMYGGLQGLNKSETAAKHGEEQVKVWRRAYDIPPPALTRDDPRFPGHEDKYNVIILK